MPIRCDCLLSVLQYIVTFLNIFRIPAARIAAATPKFTESSAPFPHKLSASRTDLHGFSDIRRLKIPSQIFKYFLIHPAVSQSAVRSIHRNLIMLRQSCKLMVRKLRQALSRQCQCIYVIIHK